MLEHCEPRKGDAETGQAEAHGDTKHRWTLTIGCVTVTGRVCKAVATSIWGSAMRSKVSWSGDVKRAGNETQSAYDRRARQWSTW
jgi:hypothetical protein